MLSSSSAALDKPLDSADKGISIRFIAFTALLAAATFSLMAGSVWFIKKKTQTNFNSRSSRLTQWAQSNSQNFIDQHMAGLNAVTQAYAKTVVPKEEFKELAAKTVRENAALSGVNYINNNFIVEEVYPFGANRTAVNLDLKSRFDVLPVAHRAITRRETAATDVIDLVQGGKGVTLYVPIFREDRWSGLIEGVLKMDDFTKTFLEKYLGPNYNYTIIDETNGREIYTSLLPTAYERSTPYDSYFTLRLGDRTWWVILHPKSPPMVLLPLILVLVLELCLGGLGCYVLWRKEI